MSNNQYPNHTNLIDPELASAVRIRSDIERYGEVRKEVWQRVVDEEQSVIAEGLKGHIHIPFEFTLRGDTLVAADGESFMQIAENGIAYADGQVAKDSRYEFRLQRAIHNYDHAKKANELARGELDVRTLVVIEPYAEEQEQQFGKEFVRSLGFHPDRKLAMLCAYQKTDSGIVMYSRGIENSQLRIWNEVLGTQKQSTTDMVGTMLESSASGLAVLDSLEAMYMSHPDITTRKKGHDVWVFLQSQTALSDHYFAELYKLSTAAYPETELKQKINRLRYDYWSALQLRFETLESGERSPMFEADAALSMRTAGQVMESRREVFAACGMSVAPVTEITASQMARELFGSGIVKCVTCPYCKVTVDAKIDTVARTIECLDCRAKVSTKTGQRIDYRQEESSFKDIGTLLVEFFFGNQKERQKTAQKNMRTKNKKRSELAGDKDLARR